MREAAQKQEKIIQEAQIEISPFAIDALEAVTSTVEEVLSSASWLPPELAAKIRATVASEEFSDLEDIVRDEVSELAHYKGETVLDRGRAAYNSIATRLIHRIELYTDLKDEHETAMKMFTNDCQANLKEFKN